jgi:UDP-N-acetyl-D-glucosamine dehydrogenase
MDIAVVGLGKIGLPLATQYASKGFRVTGVDINRRLVSEINSGIEPFPGEDNLQLLMKEAVASGHLTATTEFTDAIPSADVVVVVVPLIVGLDDQPDFSILDSATKSIGLNLRKNTLVIYETTLPIGTTRGRWKPQLEKWSGLVEGTDFDVVFSPERVLTGRVFADLKKYPKLIGALTRSGEEAATRFYTQVLDFDPRPDLARPNGVWNLGNPEAAEMAKLAETTYRDVNIGLANQFALHADEIGVDIYDVIEACNSQPYSHIHRPGISVGGHCIPVYPRLYLSTDRNPGVVGAARHLNSQMPLLAVRKLGELLGPLASKEILIFGVAYRPGVKEDAYSGAHVLRDTLISEGASVVVLDPLYSHDELRELGFEPCVNFDTVEAAILNTDHPDFHQHSSKDFPKMAGIVDGRNSLDPHKWAGIKLASLGRQRLVSP